MGCNGGRELTLLEVESRLRGPAEPYRSSYEIGGGALHLLMIGIALQSGSFSAGTTFQPLMLSLNERLKRATNGAPFTPDIEQCLVVFRVSGSIDDFQFSGIDRLTCYTKKREIRLDYGFPESSWKNVKPTDLRLSFGQAMIDSVDAAIERLRQKHLAPPSREYTEAVRRAIEDWVGPPDP